MSQWESHRDLVVAGLSVGEELGRQLERLRHKKLSVADGPLKGRNETLIS